MAFRAPLLLELLQLPLTRPKLELATLTLPIFKMDQLFFSTPKWKYTFFHKRSISPIKDKTIASLISLKIKYLLFILEGNLNLF